MNPRLVVVTGAGGFIGSHVVVQLLDRGGRGRARVRPRGRGGRGHLEGLRNSAPAAGLEVRQGDVTDAAQVRALVRDADVVLHLAALIGIPYSYEAPASYVATNTVGTLNVLQACRELGTRRVVITSTSEVYGTARAVPMGEDHPLQAQSPYAASKIAADKLAESFHLSYGLPVVVLRPFNTYGPRQSARALIPTVLSQVLSGAHEIRLGNLAPRRDMTFVEDTARAFVLAAEAPGIEGETLHFGSGTTHSVGEIARICRDTLGSSIPITCDPERQRPGPSEVELLQCNPSRAVERLGWRARVPLAEGVALTAEWVRAHLSAFAPGSYSV